jgi:hydrogenase-4 component E
VNVGSLIDSVLVSVLLLNFMLLATSRLRALINVSALQGVVLGALAVIVHGGLDARPVLLGAAAAGIKGFLIPGLLHRALRDAAIRREVEPLVGYVTSLLLGALATGGALAFASSLPLAAEHAGSLLVPGSLATVMTGFILLTARRKAITQVVGYLVLENGIFVMGLALHDAMPLLVEVGVLLDLLVGIFVIGIVINHIHREFDSLDVTRLDALRE